MATVQARVKAIFDALTNSDTPNAKIVRGTDANTGQSVAANALLSNTEKGELFLRRLREFLLNNVKAYEEATAVQAAQATVHAAVDSDFVETP